MDYDIEIKIDSEKLYPLIEEFLDAIADDILKNWQTNIKEMDIIDTGEYRDSLEIGKAEMERTIEAKCDHAVHQEFGTGPAIGKPSYIPPVEPLQKWVEHRLGVHGKDAERLAWYIRDKIINEGTEPRPAARGAFYLTIARLQEIFDSR